MGQIDCLFLSLNYGERGLWIYVSDLDVENFPILCTKVSPTSNAA